MAYRLIIAWQVATASVLVFATLWMLSGWRDARRFAAAKPAAVLGLTLGLLLYGLGFTVIGGEWFAMWQSHIWNGLDSAARFTLLDGLVLSSMFLIAPDA